VRVAWLKGEKDVINNVTLREIVSYREFFSDPRNIPSLVGERLLKGFVVPASSAEAAREFSQMNLVCIKSRSSMSASHLS
jgi:hypothetical protein